MRDRFVIFVLALAIVLMINADMSTTRQMTRQVLCAWARRVWVLPSFTSSI